MMRPPRILISAGEASGDRLGAGLARALRARRPDVDLFGMGGDEMAANGVRVVQEASDVAVVGLVEVLRHLPAIRRAMRRLAGLLETDKPDLVVPVDFPDFNLRLCARARSAGVPCVYFVSPQVWAWRRGRVRTIRKLVRRMLVLYPFEAPFYESAGVPVTFVGHPAAAGPDPARPPAAILAGIGLDVSRPAIALLPGSRRGEVKRHLPRMLGAARLVHKVRHDVQFVVPRAATLPAGLVESFVGSEAPDLPVAVRSGPYPELLTACSAAIVASGTATLDAALAGLPSVVVYRMQPISHLLARALVSVEHIALPNLVAGARILPELVQGDFTPEAAASILRRWLDHPSEADAVRAALARIREMLDGNGALDRAADAVLEELNSGTR